jgi:hypothetical protein
VSRLLAHPRKQEISLPVACLLVSVRTAPQLFKLHTRLSLYDGLQRLQERFSSSLGEGSRLPQECLLRHLALTVCSGRMRDFFSLGLLLVGGRRNIVVTPGRAFRISLLVTLVLLCTLFCVIEPGAA